jgi:hypothetical protein
MHFSSVTLSHNLDDYGYFSVILIYNTIFDMHFSIKTFLLYQRVRIINNICERGRDYYEIIFRVCRHWRLVSAVTWYFISQNPSITEKLSPMTTWVLYDRHATTRIEIIPLSSEFSMFFLLFECLFSRWHISSFSRPSSSNCNSVYSNRWSWYNFLYYSKGCLWNDGRY